jgi:DNA-binding GntR family transcriptional regulator
MLSSAKKETIPLYSRVATIIQNKILSGQYGPGQQLPTEDDLVTHYQVSKITVRNALSLLETQGLIHRTRGKGTFVADDIPEIKQSIHTNLNDMVVRLANSNTKPLDITIIKVGESRIPRDICRFFNLSNQDDIGRVRRLMTLDQVVYLYENYMPPEMAKWITKKELAEKRSILKILHKKIGLSVAKGEMYLQAIAAEPDISELLECQAFDPLIHVQTYFWDESGKPFEIVNRYLRACYFKYKVDVEISGEPS